MRYTMALLICMLLAACSDGTNTPEAQVRAMLLAAEEAAEAQDLDGFGAFLADDYSDHRRRNRSNILELAKLYFLHNRSIHILSRIESVDFPGPDIAKVELLAGMAGRNKAATSVLDLKANVYRFQLELHRGEEDDWQVRHAEWQRGIGE